MKHKKTLIGGIVFLLLFMSLLFIVGMRAGAHDQRTLDDDGIAESLLMAEYARRKLG